MARSNYSYEKRQKEVARKKKKEAKRLRRAAKRQDQTEDGSPTPADETTAEDEGAAELRDR